MTAIQAIYVRGHEDRMEPKPHTVYRIEILASVRSWQIWRRYSEFEDLNTELTKSTGSKPPAPLPPKHTWSLSRSFRNEAVVAERVAGLETYLRAIISSKDSKWRDSIAFKEFLSIPLGRSVDSGKEGQASTQFTSSSWLDEHVELQGLIREIRAEINKREALADRGDVSGTHLSNVDAQKKLAVLLTRIGTLAKGLEVLGSGGMSSGELQRRSDMVSRLQDDCEKLGKMVISARRNTRPITPLADAAASQASATKAALLGGRNSPPVVHRPTRVFGKPQQPQETAQTRPLDGQGLVQLQFQQMDQQDQQLSQLSAVLHRQKHLGVAISNEIDEQNVLLDGLNDDLDRVGGKLGATRKQMQRLS